MMVKGHKRNYDHGAVTFIPYWEKTWLLVWPFEAQVHIQMSVAISLLNKEAYQFVVCRKLTWHGSRIVGFH